MPKLDSSRDYYADLDLPSTADVAGIKKQFRKLALQYHPDRNPGREAEVNAKFQIIQSAHEILGDPEQKARYDASRPRSRYPTASGVRGNPWQDVGKDFPAPPRRNAAPNRTSRNPPPPPPPSGAQKYRNFTSGAAPTAKQPPREDPMEAKRNAWQAFEQMRPNSQGKTAASQAKNRQSRPVPPRPEPTQPSRPVPRTPGQKQKADAAFGARKPTGYAPMSPAPGDEPPVSSNSYSTNRHTYDAAAASRNAQGPIPDPLAQFRDNRGDPRQRTPYSGSSGEKTNPFDGVPLGRAKSTGEGNRHSHHESSNENISPGGSRHRSSSAPRSAGRAEESNDRPDSATPASPNLSQQNFASRASARYTPAGKGPTTSGPSTPANSNVNGKNTTSEQQPNKTNGPSMYGKAFSSAQSSFLHPQFKATSGNPSEAYTYPYGNGSHLGTYGEPATHTATSSPSGDSSSNYSDPLTPYERQQRDLLKELIGKANTPDVQTKKRQLQAQDHSADLKPTHSFSFPVDDDTFTRTHPNANRFARSSIDDISTNFVNDHDSQAWQFNAGSPQQEDPLKKRRAQSGSRLGRQSPQAPPPRPPKEPAGPNQTPSQSDFKWNAQGWGEIGAQNFVPQPSHNPSVSPTRPPARTNTGRKPKVRATMGSAGLVNDDSSSEGDVEFVSSRPVDGGDVEFVSSRPVGGGAPTTTASPDAMDIDTPPPTSTETSQPNTSARNIPVEPSRPEWRPGNVQGAPDAAQTNEAKKPEAKPAQSNPNHAGSEDSEEFRASFAELSNVAPFNQKATGLKSFSDLKSTLPFESQASDRIPVSRDTETAPLGFPQVPQAPSAPPALAIPNLRPSPNAWKTYCHEFESYMKQWDTFNGQVTEHFNTRKQKMLSLFGPGSHTSLLADEGSGALRDYLGWLQQDKDVRRKWATACDEHEKRINDFLAYQVQMQ